MANHVRGDDDVLALLNEMTGSGGSSSIEVNATAADADDATDADASYAHNQTFATLTAAYRSSPPSSPHVEILRHRCHEKFKAGFYDLFRSCAPNVTDNTSSNNNSSTPELERNRYIKSIIHSVWKCMPPHNVWERFQFSLKTLEAECVRDLQHVINDGSPEYMPPWCTNANSASDEILIQQLLSPTVHKIHAWTVAGRSKGTILEPLLPVPCIASGSDPVGDCQQRKTNDRYRRGTLTLFQEEIKFQFRRTMKQQAGGGKHRITGKDANTMSLSIDKLHSSLKNLDGASRNVSASNCKDGQKKAKKAKKSKKRSRSSSEDDENDTDDISKEEYILQAIFHSTPFQRTLQKLHKKFHYLADETYSFFLSELQKCSNRLIVEEQSRSSSPNGKRRKRKNGGGGSDSMPKISYVESDTDRDVVNSGINPNSQGQQLLVTFAGISLRINERHKSKLYSLYQRTLHTLLEHNHEQYLNQFQKLLFTILLRYDALEGAGLQSAIPPAVFRFLHKRFDCGWECFASPFNCWLEDLSDAGGRYGSAFGDTDAFFSSAGSFFNIDFMRLAEESDGCCFQANPPFASEFIEKMCHRMHQYLSTSNGDDDDADEEKKIPLMFVIFVPAWSESFGWKTIASSPYLTKHVFLSQKEDVHYYAEGTQHRRRATADNVTQHRIASFDTSVFFLQNDAAKEKWQLTVEDESFLKSAFAMNPMNDAVTENRENNSRKGKLAQSRKTTQSSQKQKQSKAVSKKKIKEIKSDNKNNKRSSAKKRLVTGGQDEMSILASMGILNSGAGDVGDELTGEKNLTTELISRVQPKNVTKSSSSRKKKKARKH